MRYLALCLFLFACGDAVAPSPPPPATSVYELVAFFYENVYPGNWDVTMTHESFQGGPARFHFYDSLPAGTLNVSPELTGELRSRMDSSRARVTVLAAGVRAFEYAQVGDSVTFNRSDEWPFQAGTRLTASEVTQVGRVCYDDPAVCADRVVLEARWARVPQ